MESRNGKKPLGNASIRSFGIIPIDYFEAIPSDFFTVYGLHKYRGVNNTFRWYSGSSLKSFEKVRGPRTRVIQKKKKIDQTD